MPPKKRSPAMKLASAALSQLGEPSSPAQKDVSQAADAPTRPKSQQTTQSGDGGASSMKQKPKIAAPQPSTNSHTETAPTDSPLSSHLTLPSLLRYVDHDLLLSRDMHNNPPVPSSTTCRICQQLGGACPAKSTFLPLTPCGCWVHYRCFIRWTGTPNNTSCDRCPGCGLLLFIWEGIAATTLLVRTGLDMADGQPDSLGPAHLTSTPANGSTDNTSTLNLSPHPSTPHVLAAYQLNRATPTDALSSLPFASLTAAYTSDCALMASYIGSMLSAHLAAPSPGYADGSPNLVFVAEDAMRLLRAARRPQSAWLRCRTRGGELCWAVLVAVKVRRLVLEQAPWVRGLVGWVEFEKAVQGLRDEIGRECRGG